MFVPLEGTNPVKTNVLEISNNKLSKTDALQVSEGQNIVKTDVLEVSECQRLVKIDVLDVSERQHLVKTITQR